MGHEWGTDDSMGEIMSKLFDLLILWFHPSPRYYFLQGSEIVYLCSRVGKNKSLSLEWQGGEKEGKYCQQTSFDFSIMSSLYGVWFRASIENSTAKKLKLDLLLIFEERHVCERMNGMTMFTSSV